MSEWSAAESERRTHEEGFTGGFNPWVVALTVTLATFMEVLDTSIATSRCRISPAASRSGRTRAPGCSLRT